MAVGMSPSTAVRARRVPVGVARNLSVIAPVHPRIAGALEPEAVSAGVLARVARHRPESFFLSASWLEACLASWIGKAGFQVLQLGQRDPAFALIGAAIETRHRVLPVRLLAVNQSCLRELDQPWIEHNGFFGGASARFEEHLVALLDILGRNPRWDELRFSGLIAAHAALVREHAARHGLRTIVELDQPVHWTDLEHVRDLHDGDYLAALSTNTRQQLRRTRRLVERELGPVRLDQAADVGEALEWFAATAPLHLAQWPASLPPGYASGFANVEFVQFHRRLIGSAFPKGSLQYLRLSAGDRVLAYLYCFVSDGHVHFYLSGIDYSTGRQFRPGMLAHWLAIEHNARLGHRVYDFLAGDDRYKESLATGCGRMQWLVLQRPRWKFRLENAARDVKRALFGSSAQHRRHPGEGFHGTP